MTWRPFSDSNQQPMSVSDSLDQLARRLGTPSMQSLKAVFANWENVVGKEIGQHAEPQLLKDGVLTVFVDDQRWLTQLRWLAPQLIERLNAEYPETAIERLDVRFRAASSPN